MSLLLSSANARRTPIPYPLKRDAPYNAPVPAFVPTPDGTGSALHYSALDFGDQWFAGYRFWLAYTPYFDTNDNIEDPSLACSHNGFHFSLPPGGSNPISPRPPGEIAYNSDVDIEFDPDTGLLHMWWREVDFTDPDNRRTTIMHSSTADGATWAKPFDKAMEVWSPSQTRFISPSVIRRGPGDWLMYVGEELAPSVCTAPSPLGPWSAPAPLDQQGEVWGAWHFDFIRATDGIYYGLVSRGDHKYRAVSSVDGIAWRMNPDNILEGRAGAWDGSLYRGSLTEHEDGQHFRIWYSGRGMWHDLPRLQWRLGHTMMPRSLWPDPT